MYSPSILTPLVAFSFSAPAASDKLFDGPEFTITTLSATFPSTGPDGLDRVNSFVDIALTYPENDAILSTTCRVDWPAGTNPGPTAWTPCANKALQFRLPADGWTSTTNFRVEAWQTLTSKGAGLDASHYITSNPENPSDPNAYMFCLQMGKFNPLTCSLTGPLGESPRTVVMPATKQKARPKYKTEL